MITITDGTQCHNCYGIFAESASGNFHIGVRPLVAVHGNMSFIGFRVRAMPKPSAEQELIAANSNIVELGNVPKGMAESIVSAFPGVQFSKADDVRASFVGGTQFGIGMEHVAALREIYQSTRFCSKLMNALTQMIQQAGGKMVNEEELYEWLMNGYLSEFNNIIGNLNEYQKPDSVQLEKDPADVVVPLFDTVKVAALPKEQAANALPAPDDE